jgi:CheY-like chemotaxis protein
MFDYRVYVVEDNRDAADSLAMVLRSWGYQVRTAYDAPSALADVETFTPDAILSDLRMPGMSGWALAEKLAGEGVLLIATTGCSDEASRQASKEAGFHEHLTKPLDLDLLHRLLEEHREGVGIRTGSG